MTELSNEFEKQIERIHKLIEDTEAKITWNDKIPDPDSPNQVRQIDITISRDSKLTLIECRLHKAKQDVQWIEELIGRRISLKADSVIAVSSSGFSELAKTKAEKHGIILREINELTEDEVRNWGKCATTRISFFRFSKLSIAFLFPADAQSMITPDDVLKATHDNGIFMKSMLEQVCHKIDESKPKYPISIKVELGLQKPLEVKGFKSERVAVRMNLNVEERELLTPVVLAYESSQGGLNPQQAHVEKKDLGKTEVIQVANKVSMLMDLSALPCEPNQILNNIGFDFQRTVRMKHVHVIASNKFSELQLKDVAIGVGFRK